MPGREKSSKLATAFPSRGEKTPSHAPSSRGDATQGRGLPSWGNVVPLAQVSPPPGITFHLPGKPLPSVAAALEVGARQ